MNFIRYIERELEDLKTKIVEEEEYIDFENYQYLLWKIYESSNLSNDPDYSKITLEELKERKREAAERIRVLRLKIQAIEEFMARYHSDANYQKVILAELGYKEGRSQNG